MQQYEKDNFYSLLFFTELLCSGHSSESSKVCKYVNNALSLAKEIIEYAVQNNNFRLYNEIITASKNLDLSNKQSVLTGDTKEIVNTLYQRFTVQIGNLLKENVSFLREYNDYLVALTSTGKRKSKVK